MSKPYSGISVSIPHLSKIKRRYSVTSDVVAFRRCARQYGAFKPHNYAPAYQTQLYFGTIIHQVLDRCHSHYHGSVDPSTKGLIPDSGLTLSNSDIQDYFDAAYLAHKTKSAPPIPPSAIVKYFVEVENGLKSRGIRAVTPDLRVQAIRILQYFNTLEGPVLYQKVVDTEHRLQADRTDHILHGVVDLLVGTTTGSNTNPAECEIWDYKGKSRISLTPKDLETYEFQMRVYAKLYELKHGVQPKRAVLYFLNELDGPTSPTVRPVNALLSVDIDPMKIDVAVNEFAATVAAIEQARTSDNWSPAAPGSLSEQDCSICDLRWDCPTPNKGKGVSLRYP
jgi:hypothetical protein